ncbi:hypothetical protein GCM10009738_72140 [Kitasatospora viridis]
MTWTDDGAPESPGATVIGEFATGVGAAAAACGAAAPAPAPAPASATVLVDATGHDAAASWWPFNAREPAGSGTAACCDLPFSG